MGLYPKIQAYDGGMEVVDVFRGLNRAEKISEGEWSDELNLTSDRFPMLSVRKARSTPFDFGHAHGNVVDMIAKDRLYLTVVNTDIEVGGMTEPVGISLMAYEDGSLDELRQWVIEGHDKIPKSMLSFGAYIILPETEVWYNTADGTDGTITGMPKMDYVIECQNRLWGCYYGEKEVEENGETVTKTVNEIYASELGKFDSWSNYDGTSMAAYAASVGTDGKWTGAVSYQGRPHFFKEKHVHKVYISASGAHQIVDNPILGVQEGCSNSLCVLDGVLYYVSRDGVCAYDGSAPKVISEELGDSTVQSAFFGASKGKLYAMMNEQNGSAETTRLYVYDTRRGLWHEETLAVPYGIGASAAFAALGDSLYVCDATKGIAEPKAGDYTLWDFNGEDGTPEDAVSYSCTSGLIGWQNIEQKYISRFDLRLTLPQGATMKVEIEYDSSGTWEEQGTVNGGGTGSVVIPVRPRRCDHFRLRLSGHGEMRMYSWAKRLTKGSDVVL